MKATTEEAVQEARLRAAVEDAKWSLNNAKATLRHVGHGVPSRMREDVTRYRLELERRRQALGAFLRGERR